MAPRPMTHAFIIEGLSEHEESKSLEFKPVSHVSSQIIVYMEKGQESGIEI